MSHWRKLFDNTYLGAWDLEDGDVIVTIKRVVVETITGQNGKKDQCPVMYFEGGRGKGMIVNKTNAKTAAKMYGNDVDAWIGKRIRLYADTTSVGGETVPCVRVRAGVPPGKLKDGRVGDGTGSDPQGPDGVPSGADELRTALGDEE